MSGYLKTISREVDDLRRCTEEVRPGIWALRFDAEHVRRAQAFARSLVEAGAVADVVSREVDDLLQLWRAWGVWGSTGKNVFHVSPAVTAAMLMADLATVEIADLRLPHPSIFMVLPEGFVRGVEGRSYTRVWVSAATVTAGRGTVVLSIDDGIPQELPGVEMGVEIMAQDGTHTLSVRVSSAALAAGGWRELDRIQEGDAAAPSAPDDRDALAAIERIVFGVLAFVNSSPGSVRREDTTQSRRASDIGGIATWSIGRDVVIDKRIVDACRRGAREVAFRLRRRHVVRGHWRNQAHGVGRLERRRQWIAPFWKGPEGGAEIVHTYKPVVD